MPNTNKNFNEEEYYNELVPLYIPDNEADLDDKQVYISVNKYSAVIKRGQQVQVPRFVYLAYMDSLEHKKKSLEFKRNNKVKEAK